MARVPFAIDLFSGAGGLGEGLEAAGIRIPVAVELHPQPALTYAFNHPNSRVVVGDMRWLSADLLVQLLSESTGLQTVDLIVGGPPCQGFSTAGKKVLTDPRNNLFWQFARFLDHFRPRMFLLENVPGFEKMHHGRAFAQAFQAFADLGYRIDHRVLDAALYGVPQRRQRFIMVGWLPDKTARFEWPKPTHALGGEQMSLAQAGALPFVSVSDALDDVAFLEPGWEAHVHREPPRSDYQRARRSGCDLLFNHLATRHRPDTVKMFSLIAEGETISRVPGHLRSRKRTMARLERHSISNAVLALPDDLIHYRHNRIPTVREMARLQSFDDDYVFFGKRTSGFVDRRVDVPQYTQVGNAVPPVLAQALGVSLVASLGGNLGDLRNVTERRARHRWVRGISGYAGYTLDPDAETEIVMETVRGERLQLPVSTGDCPVHAAENLYDWTKRPRSTRRQWSPGVEPLSTPAHVGASAER